MWKPGPRWSAARSTPLRDADRARPPRAAGSASVPPAARDGPGAAAGRARRLRCLGGGERAGRSRSRRHAGAAGELAAASRVTSTATSTKRRESSRRGCSGRCVSRCRDRSGSPPSPHRLTAAALIAQQVAGNAIRDGLFLSLSSRCKACPTSWPARRSSRSSPRRSRDGCSARFGPRAGRARLSRARTRRCSWWSGCFSAGSRRRRRRSCTCTPAVMGAIAISSFWSLLNERFDPHSAKPLMARVAAAATFGGFVGGVSAERVVALLPQGSLLPMLGVARCGLASPARWPSGEARRPPRTPSRRGGRRRARGRSSGSSRCCATWPLVIALAAMVAALADYLLKVEAVAYFGQGPQLVRFFGLFYAGTGLAAVLIAGLRSGVSRSGGSASAARSRATRRVVGAASPALGSCCHRRGAASFLARSTSSCAARRSVPDTSCSTPRWPKRRSARPSRSSTSPVIAPEKARARVLILVLVVSLVPSHPFVAVNLAVAVAAARRVASSRVACGRDTSARSRAGCGARVSISSKRSSTSMADFTVVEKHGRSRSGGGSARPRIAGHRQPAATRLPIRPWPRSSSSVPGDVLRIRAALRDPPRDPIDHRRPGAAAGEGRRRASGGPRRSPRFGARAAGEMVSVLLDPATPDVIRRRLPLALKSCPSPIARDGLRGGARGIRFRDPAALRPRTAGAHR